MLALVRLLQDAGYPVGEATDGDQRVWGADTGSFSREEMQNCPYPMVVLYPDPIELVTQAQQLKLFLSQWGIDFSEGDRDSGCPDIEARYDPATGYSAIYLFQVTPDDIRRKL